MKACYASRTRCSHSRCHHFPAKQALTSREQNAATHRKRAPTGLPTTAGSTSMKSPSDADAISNRIPVVVSGEESAKESCSGTVRSEWNELCSRRTKQRYRRQWKLARRHACRITKATSALHSLFFICFSQSIEAWTTVLYICPSVGAMAARLARPGTVDRPWVHQNTGLVSLGIPHYLMPR